MDRYELSCLPIISLSCFLSIKRPSYGYFSEPFLIGSFININLIHFSDRFQSVRSCHAWICRRKKLKHLFSHTELLRWDEPTFNHHISSSISKTIGFLRFWLFHSSFVPHDFVCLNFKWHIFCVSLEISLFCIQFHWRLASIFVKLLLRMAF